MNTTNIATTSNIIVAPGNYSIAIGLNSRQPIIQVGTGIRFLMGEEAETRTEVDGRALHGIVLTEIGGDNKVTIDAGDLIATFNGDSELFEFEDRAQLRAPAMPQPTRKANKEPAAPKTVTPTKVMKVSALLLAIDRHAVATSQPMPTTAAINRMVSTMTDMKPQGAATYVRSGRSRLAHISADVVDRIEEMVGEAIAANDGKPLSDDQMIDLANKYTTEFVNSENERLRVEFDAKASQPAEPKKAARRVVKGNAETTEPAASADTGDNAETTEPAAA